MTDGDDFVDSPSDATIVAAIRERYLRDATLAIVLLGESTWSRRFVDWEIAAALGGHGDVPLAMLAVTVTDQAPARLPPRLRPLCARPIALCADAASELLPAALAVTATASARHGCSDPPPLMRRDFHRRETE